MSGQNERRRVHAIVLAAGRSQRMGTQKLLLPFAQSTVIGHVVGRVAESLGCLRGAPGVSGILVVVGEDGPAIAEALGSHPVTMVPNPDPSGGMIGSVRCGLCALPAGSDAALIVLGDQPGITPQLIDRLIDAFGSSGKGIAVPIHEGRRGHPLLISMAYRDIVMSGYDSVGLRGLLSDHPEDVFELPVASSQAIRDMDYPEDYARELERFRAETQR